MASGSAAQDAIPETRFGIEPELEERVKTQAERFQTAYRRTIEEAWKLGGELRQAKSQVRHGQWIPWIEERIGLTPRSAQRLMAVHAAYPEIRQLSRFLNVSHALRVLPSGQRGEGEDEAPPESGTASGADAASSSGSAIGGEDTSERDNGRVAAAARELSRVVERLEPILHARPAASTVHQEFPALCEALQTIVSAMIGYADTAAGGGTTSARELVSALERALATARQVRDSILARNGR